MDETTISQVAPEGMVSPRRNGKRFILPVLIVAILLAALFAGGKYVRSRGEEIPTPTPLQAPIETPTPTSGPTSTPVSTTKATPTKKPTPTKEATSSANTKGLIVRVLNGSGISGRAASLAEYLEGLGYEIGGTGNADNPDYDKSTITIK